MLGKDAKQITRVAKAAQTRLGEHQDSVVTRSVLRELGIAAHLDGDSVFTFGLLHGLEQQHADMIEREFSRTWETRSAPKLRPLLR